MGSETLLTINAGELLARSQVLGEMLANGIVEYDGETYTINFGRRTFMVEVRLLECTGSGNG